MLKSKNFKKLLSITLACVMMVVVSVSGIGSIAFADENNSIYRVNSNENICEISAAEVIVVDYSELNLIEESAKELVDDGKLLYIIYPEASAEDIAELLNIPKKGITSYKDEILFAYSIFNVNDEYIYENHYAIIVDEGNNDATQYLNEFENLEQAEKELPLAGTSNFDEVLVQNANSYAVNEASFANLENIERAIASKNEFISEIDTLNHKPGNDVRSRSSELPTVSADCYFNDSLYVYNSSNKYFGYIRATVQTYGIGYSKVNNTTNYLYNVVGTTKAYPDSNFIVEKYKTQLHCNIVGHTLLDSTTLPSSISYTKGLSLSGTYKDGFGVTISYNTAWTYNPESQIITESSSSPRVVTWTAEPVNPAAGKAFDMAPGITVSSGGVAGQRGAFSKVFCDAYVFFGLIVSQTNELEVGGWF